MKRCTNCGVVKSLNDFHTQVGHKDGYRSHCKLCRRFDYFMKQEEKRKYMEYHNLHKWLGKYGEVCFENPVVEIKAPAPRVNVWEWIKRLFG